MSILPRLPLSLETLRLDEPDVYRRVQKEDVAVNHLLATLEQCRTWVSQTDAKLTVEYFLHPLRPRINLERLAQIVEEFAQEGLRLQFGMQEWQRVRPTKDIDQVGRSCYG